MATLKSTDKETHAGIEIPASTVGKKKVLLLLKRVSCSGKTHFYFESEGT